MLQPGQVISGRYLLGSRIGEGAMGSVWRAEDQTLRRQVAIKFLFLRPGPDPAAHVEQFLREARIAASVQHRNVIHIVDFGTLDNHQPYMVMELLNGEDLSERLAREPRLTPAQFIQLISVTLRGLGAVHDAGIVHRDLKPENIFLQRDAEAAFPKILDFGISRSLDASDKGRASAIATTDGLIVGTPEYMSPEQARGQADIDKRSDIYSVGVILYEGLAGRPPFDAENVGDLIVQIMTQHPPDLRELCPQLPAAVADVVAQAMHKDRAHRFADARALRNALLTAARPLLPETLSTSALPAQPPPIVAPPAALFGAPPPALGAEGLPPASPARPQAATGAETAAAAPAARQSRAKEATEAVPDAQPPAAAAVERKAEPSVGWGDFEGITRAPARDNPPAAEGAARDTAAAAATPASEDAGPREVAARAGGPPRDGANTDVPRRKPAVARQPSRPVKALELDLDAAAQAVMERDTSAAAAPAETDLVVERNAPPRSAVTERSSTSPRHSRSQTALQAQSGSVARASSPAARPSPERNAAPRKASAEFPAVAAPAQPKAAAAKADPGSAERGGSAAARKSVGGPPTAPGIEIDALDPLYAGADQAAPDIDYERVHNELKKPQQRNQAPAATPARAPAKAARSAVQRSRGRGRSSWLSWMLPLLALGLLGYAFFESLFSGFGWSQAAGAGKRSSSEVSPSADPELRQLRMQVKARRRAPGKLPPHMRDVEF